jgi:tRNA A-37 threonylcarbamoyl transferase component Bud32
MSSGPVRRCHKCSQTVPAAAPVCPFCSAPLTVSLSTRTAPEPELAPPTVDEGGFPEGALLAERYRIASLLGRGGMGEVYRAYDTLLRQTVAIKVFFDNRADDAVERYRNEVRMARTVTHPNVCRVYDIVLAEGHHFISMEYIDGEDLRTLLRRVGRLSEDKGMEFARRICAGLAAAHERGVLHRDLKPANIMVDSRGRVRITDFGLAAFASQIPARDLRSGTPAYMAPEQRDGREVTIRSDIYSLGLVLFEIFTGRSRTSADFAPNALIEGLNPEIERVILWCLEDDPRRRPGSALAVAMSLPGGDPILNAIAAGETPSPEMVAASRGKEGLQPATACVCFAALILVLAGLAVGMSRFSLLSKAPLGIPAPALAFRAQELLRELGYREEPRGMAYGFACCDLRVFDFLERLHAADRDNILATHQPPVIRFWYRQHRDRFRAVPLSIDSNGVVTWDSPANNLGGMVRVVLDAKGRLNALEARATSATEDSAAAPDWAPLFRMAGLAPDRFNAVTPTAVPQLPFDLRMAWNGSYAEGLREPVRVEVAFFRGRPVFFSVAGSWQQGDASGFGDDAGLGAAVARPLDSSATPIVIFMCVQLLAWVIGAVLLARRNLRQGRSDKRGAALAAAPLVLYICSWALKATHIDDSFWEFNLFSMALLVTGALTVMVWVFYVAAEPYMRRRWPDCLISWTRVHTGRLLDPLVASHILVGVLAQVTVFFAGFALITALSRGRAVFMTPSIDSLIDDARFAAAMFEVPGRCSAELVEFLISIVLLRFLVRKLWLADVIGAGLLGGAMVTPWLNAHPLAVGYNCIAVYSLLVVLRRFGYLAVWAALGTQMMLLVLPISLHSWYAGRSVIALLFLACLGGWALWVILRPHAHQGDPSARSTHP